jgi:hypothetical protein
MVWICSPMSALKPPTNLSDANQWRSVQRVSFEPPCMSFRLIRSHGNNDNLRHRRQLVLVVVMPAICHGMIRITSPPPFPFPSGGWAQKTNVLLFLVATANTSCPEMLLIPVHVLSGKGAIVCVRVRRSRDGAHAACSPANKSSKYETAHVFSLCSLATQVTKLSLVQVPAGDCLIK